MPESRRIADRYVLKQILGRGGMGTVWLAHDELLGRSVAVKEVRFPESLSEQELSVARARVMREARAAARIDHPNAVTIFDVHEGEGTTFIVMELVDAPSLAEAVERGGPIDVPAAAKLGLRVLDALDTAHANGIVHRDVKPSNILLAPETGAKLADFGIASIQHDPRLTATGTLLGSPQFMAPERALGRPATPASDLWALGATLFFAVEGRAPFNEGSSLATLRAVVSTRPRPIERAGTLEPVIASLLAKEPEDRPGPDVLRARLEAIATGTVDVPATKGTGGVRAAPAEHPGTPELGVSSVVLVPQPRPRPSQGWLLAGLLAVVALVAATVSLMSGGTPERGRDSHRDGQGTRAERTERDEPGPRDISSGWIRHRDRDVKYSMSYPPGWDVVQVTDTITDFRDPAGGTYLRIDWTGEPGPSPEAAWEQLSARLAQSKDGYREIGITPTTYKGFDAAVLEFTYSEAGTDLHAVDLGFVTDEYGFALNFQTREQDWEASQDLFEELKDEFHVPGRS